ncbi:hypothetical protein DNFV4_00944 [Nitrospira tepida]|uniref:Uncharacterized protein n=1 Tax=Nitrospira tepida TaxID=2973512 RepID=A0AA86T2J3_9BACT|nr:hypothetical protein DNFV4_00944 [Nitrospira tepida]
MSYLHTSFGQGGGSQAAPPPFVPSRINSGSLQTVDQCVGRKSETLDGHLGLDLREEGTPIPSVLSSLFSWGDVKVRCEAWISD